MSFDISMEFLGLNEMQKEIERLSTESELKALNKKIIKRAGEIGLQEAEGQIRKKAYSSNPMKSGRKGSRTGQHAADNVPKKGTTQSGNYGELVGWDRGDTSPFFYMRNSYKDCLESDLSDLLDYVVFQVEYDRETQAKE